MRQETCLLSNIKSASSQITRKKLNFILYRPWDLFALSEYQKLAMEEENQEDVSDLITNLV
jgi:hypothetical protein